MNTAAFLLAIVAFLSFFAAAIVHTNKTQSGFWRLNWLAIGLACATLAVILQLGLSSGSKIFPT